ncbi:hypothetical protein D9M68_991900 [compost metagenome]
MVARRLIAHPVGVAGVPVARQAADVGLEPAAGEVELGTQAVDHGGIAALPNVQGDICCLSRNCLTEGKGCGCSPAEKLLHENNPFSEVRTKITHT